MSIKRIFKTRRKVRVLFTCIGRRVSLLESFRRAARSLKLEFEAVGTDINELSPALQLCEKKYIVSRADEPSYIKEILHIVKTGKIDLLVPTVDLDLAVLAANREQLKKLGCTALVSKPEVVAICRDKRRTFEFLKANGFDAPLTMDVKEALVATKLKYPCFLKPRDGSGGKKNTIVYNREELKFFSRRVPKCIVQEFVKADEYTCDVFVDFGMKIRCVVPRKRIETRSGEVSKGQIVKNRNIMAEAARLTELLGAGPGVVTVQCFLLSDGTIKFNEINPRFGGGVPLAIKGGANFPKWILMELFRKKPAIRFDGFEDGLLMLRFDGEIWLEMKVRK